MIDFSNKYLTIAALCIVVYMFSGTVKDMKNNNSAVVDGAKAKYKLVVDPHKNSEDYTMVERLALFSLPADAKKQMDIAKEETLSPKDLKVQIGDKVFIEVDFINSKEKESTKSFSIKVGEVTEKLETFTTDVLLGMGMNEERIVENPSDPSDIREVKVLYIERFKHPKNGNK